MKKQVIYSLAFMFVLAGTGSVMTLASVSKHHPTATTQRFQAVPTVLELENENEPLFVASQTQPKKVITDTTPPVLAVANPEMTVEQGSAVNIYEGVTATDNVDGDLTNQLVADADLDTQIPGVYTIHFSVTDHNGNAAQAEKNITVLEPANPTEPANVAAAQAVIPEQTTAAEAVTPAQEATPEETKAPTQPAMTMLINGQTIPYQNGGQAVGQSLIDANPTGTIATWGGAVVQSGTDNQNTHFIGHNPGIFSVLFTLGMGSHISVTDASGQATIYAVTSSIQVDDAGQGIQDHNDYWDAIVSPGNTESITLQTCIDEQTNLIVFASKTNEL